MNDCLVVIPARLASTRFPAKVLATLRGRPIVEWCRRAALAARVGPVVVATDHPKVAHAVEYFGGEAALTPASLASGTDRVWAVARARRARFVINLQGDEPLIKAATIRKVAELLRDRPDADIATAIVPLADRKRYRDPNIVKAAVGADGRCLYFSRATIPYTRASTNKTVRGANQRRFQHVGIYGFRYPALRRFVELPPSPLERLECLEQLRALEAGMTIFAVKVNDRTVAIDTPGDMARAERTLQNA
ncbi:MAG: 3-deoxy-manno-octulosonate cytidylyltransferase [Elusimicrobia bacterium]|nr:3-deoxy-manno-octulosonate cytidylyltransferase [Elusimicrobiota bacterium]